MSGESGPKGPKRTSFDVLKNIMPTSRHAEMLIEALRVKLADTQFVDTYGNGRVQEYFLCDRTNGLVVDPECRFRIRFGERRYLEIHGVETLPIPNNDHLPPLRLKNLKPCEVDLKGTGFSFSAAWGKDGRIYECSVDGRPSTEEFIFSQDKEAGDHPVLALADRILEHSKIDTHTAGVYLFGETRLPIRQAFATALEAARQKLGWTPYPADFTAIDGVSGSIIEGGATIEEAIARCREEIRRVNPQPKRPQDPSELPAQVREYLESPEGKAAVAGSRFDFEAFSFVPDDVPVVVLCTYFKRTLPRYGRYITAFDDRGTAAHFVLEKIPGGSLVLSPSVAERYDVASLLSMIDNHVEVEPQLKLGITINPQEEVIPKPTMAIETYLIEETPTGPKLDHPGSARCLSFHPSLLRPRSDHAVVILMKDPEIE
jgi:hypothetical protein